MTTPDTEEEVPFYRTPETKVRPGDIVSFSPAFQALKKPVAHLGIEQSKGDRVLAELHGGTKGAAVPAAVQEGRKDTKFVVPGRLDFGLLLTRGCDIDHGRLRQLAAIRPLSAVQGVEDQAAVIEGRHTSLHYLPPAEVAGQRLFDRSFVDFRYIVTLHESLFETLTRPISLSREALFDVHFGWLRHTTGKEIPQSLPCAKCGEMVEVFAQVEEIAAPDADY
jgi:hypothetical protein